MELSHPGSSRHFMNNICMDLTWTRMDIVEDSEPAPGKFQLLYLLFYSLYWLEKSSNLPHRFYVFEKNIRSETGRGFCSAVGGSEVSWERAQLFELTCADNKKGRQSRCSNVLISNLYFNHIFETFIIVDLAPQFSAETSKRRISASHMAFLLSVSLIK